MAFQAVPDTAEIVVNYTFNTQTFNNVLYALHPGGYNLIDLQELADAVDAAISANWLPQQTQDVAYVKTVVNGLGFVNDQTAEANLFAGAGAVLAPALPGNVTISIKKASPFTGRSARGRLYWIGIPDTKLQVNENLLAQNYVDDVVTAVDAIRLAINVSSWTAVLVSRFSDGLPRSPGVTFGWVGTSAVDANVDSMRRRLLS